MYVCLCVPHVVVCVCLCAHVHVCSRMYMMRWQVNRLHTAVLLFYRNVQSVFYQMILPVVQARPTADKHRKMVTAIGILANHMYSYGSTHVPARISIVAQAVCCATGDPSDVDEGGGSAELGDQGSAAAT